MESQLSAPKTRGEWGIFAGLMIVFYAVILLLTTDEILYSLVMGVMYGLMLTAALVVLVAAWRVATKSANRT